MYIRSGQCITCQNIQKKYTPFSIRGSKKGKHIPYYFVLNPFGRKHAKDQAVLTREINDYGYVVIPGKAMDPKNSQKQIWCCENCRTVGTIDRVEDMGVYKSVQEMHKSHMELSPECGKRFAKVRPIFDTNDLPIWAKEKARELLEKSS